MVDDPAISQSRRGDTDRDHKALNAIARAEPDLALDPAELAQWSERPEIRRVLDAACWLEERHRRVLAHRVIEQAMDHLSAALGAKADLTVPSQRAEVRRAATALADLAITLLHGPPRSRSRAAAHPAAFPSFSAASPRLPGAPSPTPTGVSFTRRAEPVSAPAAARSPSGRSAPSPDPHRAPGHASTAGTIHPNPPTPNGAPRPTGSAAFGNSPQDHASAQPRRPGVADLDHSPPLGHASAVHRRPSPPSTSSPAHLLARAGVAEFARAADTS